MKKIFFSFTCLISFTMGFTVKVGAQTANNISEKSSHNISELQEFDLRYYSPINYGLKDLVFEARVSGLTKNLNERQSFGKLVDVYFKIFWIFPDKFQIEVMGLPQGFNEFKNELKQMVVDKLDFVVPETFGARFKGYHLTRERIGNETILRGRDPSNVSAVSELALYFDNRGKINKMESRTPMGLNTTSVMMNAKSWSHNKWVLEEMNMKTSWGDNHTFVNHKINYMTEKGIGFPSKIDIKTVYEVKTRVDDKDKNIETQKQEQMTLIELTKYEVNTGKAKRFMTEGLKN